MVIDDPNIEGVTVAPLETNPPLLIDPDTPLAQPITLKRLKHIARRDGKVAQISSGIELLKLPQCTLLDIARQLP